jgi:hypothetical protein
MRIRSSVAPGNFAALVVLFLALLLAATPAFAQGRGPVPDAGMIAAGASIGISFPTDDRLKSGVDLAANIEGYLSKRVSIRGQLRGTWQDFQGQNFNGSVKPLVLDGNLVYNWEGGKWHPYLTAGGGVYHFGFEENGINGSDTAAGFDVGGGLEYFFHRHATFTTELLYHRVGTITTALAPFGHPDFWTLDFGLKRYF